MAKDKTKAKESKVIRYFKGVKAEFRKIIWPDRDTMLKQLAAVLIVTVILGALIALLDFGFQNLIDFLTSLSLNS